MENIDSSASRREMVNWLRGCSKNEVVAVSIQVNRLQNSVQIPLYLPKDGILKCLLDVDKDVLWDAIDNTFDDADVDCEDEDDVDLVEND